MKFLLAILVVSVVWCGWAVKAQEFAETSPVVEPVTPKHPPTPPTPTVPSCIPGTCDQIHDQIAVDSNNKTALTTAITQAFKTWNKKEKNIFRGYKKRIEAIVYEDNKSPKFREKHIANVVSGFTKNAKRAARVYDIQIACWGTIRKFVKCVNKLYGTHYKIW
ncbi:hypothetical protein M3Y97_00663300 [Aphelenchoides bicaudatus]|nr:hypothetical protein M3Y97_00663300 [Aphelenchoides bicaudatus]